VAFSGVPVREALDSALVALKASGVDTPRLDAEVLLAHALGIDRTRLVLEADRPVEGAAVRTFRDAVRRRTVGREPVAYITGTRGFRHLDLAVDPRVLIPRPETETLVEVALGLPRGARVHDLGTGSGAIALALKQERPDLVVSASDASPGAVAVARANAERLGLDVAFHVAHWLDGLDLELDALVSNPPYVAEGDRAALAPEITRHEPSEALFAGPEGLDAYRAIAPLAPAWAAVEVGQGQAAAVAALFAAAGLTGSAVHRDLAGIERVVVAWRS
jgi:release factor glutamine methyltransferase